MASQKCIIYSLISRKDVVLCEETLGSAASKSTGNFAQITMNLLPKFSTAGKHTFHYDEKYDFHVLNDGGISYIALSDRDLQLRIAFSYLNDVMQNFTTTYGQRAKTAQAYSMSEFSSTLQKLMTQWNDPNADVTTRVQQKLDNVKGVMIDNIDKILDRGEKLDIIVDKSEALADTADLFIIIILYNIIKIISIIKKDASKLKCEMLKQRAKLYIFIAIIIIIIIIIIIVNSVNKNNSS
ncbi:hypothetical protein WA158_008456 [Blastocystis sp. Blastoise]